MKIISDIDSPWGITEGNNGEIIVVSIAEHKVFVYAPEKDYQLVQEIGGDGYCDGMFVNPYGAALTPDHLIVVCSCNKLQWFTMAGNLVHVVGCAHKDEDFERPVDVAVSQEGRVFVLDSEKKCIKVFNSDATFHNSFGFPHLKTKKDNPPDALAISSEGNLYFADAENCCVRVFSLHGEPLFKFGKSGSLTERGSLICPRAIAIDHEDRVFVGNAMFISIFDKFGSFVRAFGGNGSDPGQFNLINALHISKNGLLFVSEYSNNRVQVFKCSEPSQSNGDDSTFDKDAKTLLPHSFRRPIYTVGPTSEKPVKLISNVVEPVGVATAANGDIFVLSKKGKKVVILDHNSFELQGEIKRLIGGSSRDSDMIDLTDLTVCEDGCLIVTLKHQIVKITLLGEVIAEIAPQGQLGHQYMKPGSVAVGRNGQLYVLDEKSIQIFNADLSYRSTAKLPDRLSKGKVAANSEGIIYVTDSANQSVHVLDCEGKFQHFISYSYRYRPRGLHLSQYQK